MAAQLVEHQEVRGLRQAFSDLNDDDVMAGALSHQCVRGFEGHSVDWQWDAEGLDAFSRLRHTHHTNLGRLMEGALKRVGEGAGEPFPKNDDGDHLLSERLPSDVCEHTHRKLPQLPA
jgi:hypothetical protein